MSPVFQVARRSCGRAVASVIAIGGALLAIDARPAGAHGVVGKRFFPATIATDDPFVADELSLPTVSTFKSPAAGDEPATRETEISAELAKRITRDFGLSVGYGWKHLKPDDQSARTGWDNLELGAKYQVFQDAPSETLVSLGVSAEIGGTGSRRVDTDRFSTFTPAVFFGKGFGDLPDSVELLKPLAVTGVVGLGFPTHAKSSKSTVNPDTGETDFEVERHSNVVQWGFALEYSLPYLQSSVRDVGLGDFFGRLIPLVEFAFEAPINRNDSGKTTGSINPGIIWAGRFAQVGIEAIIPVNDRTGHNVGVLAQLHFYLDDLFPNSLGRPVFGK